MKSILLVGFCFWLGCNHCGDGIIDPEEACDDGNNIGGDVCGAQCSFEVPKTDYRLSEMIFIDTQLSTRFAVFNTYLTSCIHNVTIEDGLHFLFHFDSTQEGPTTFSFGPGVFVDEVGGVDIFDFEASTGGVDTSPTTIDTTINEALDSNEVVTVTGASLFLPIDVSFGEGVYEPLLLQDVSISARFGHEQDSLDLSFVDVLEDDSTFSATVSVLDLCSINVLIADVPNNLLDAFDDGVVPIGSAEQLLSSIVPPPGITPDPSNCRPCQGPGVDPLNCVFPDIDPNGDPTDPSDDDGDERYTVQGTFEARDDVVINPLP